MMMWKMLTAFVLICSICGKYSSFFFIFKEYRATITESKTAATTPPPPSPAQSQPSSSPPPNSPSLKVLSLNTWGMPDSFWSHMISHMIPGFGSYDKDLRMKAIGDMINKTEYDIYLLQELWMRADHDTINQRIPSGWSMTTVEQMNSGRCDGE